jgi:hypothetical protein
MVNKWLTNVPQAFSPVSAEDATPRRRLAAPLPPHFTQVVITPGYSFTGLSVKCIRQQPEKTAAAAENRPIALNRVFRAAGGNPSVLAGSASFPGKIPGPSTMKEQKKRDEVRKYYIHA